MGSLDHDFEEINHINVFNKSRMERQTRGATGRYTTQRFAAVLEDLKTIVGNDKYTAELMDIFSKAYQQDNLSKMQQDTWYMHFFGKYGLVVIDGDDAELKQQFTRYYKMNYCGNTQHNWLNEQIDKLESSGYKQQAFPRPINLFYLGENSRERIEYTCGY